MTLCTLVERLDRAMSLGIDSLKNNSQQITFESQTSC